MNTTYLTRARHLFDRPYIPRHIVRHNCRAWARSVRMLGDKWLGLPQRLEKGTV